MIEHNKYVHRQIEAGYKYSKEGSISANGNNLQSRMYW
jgi:hypothetical protein